MITTHLALAILATTFRGNSAPVPDAVVAKYDKECADKKGAACDSLLGQLERRLYDDLRVLYDLGETIDREVLRTAAAATYPPLAVFGLERLGSGFTKADEAPVIAQLNHPSPAVRRKAQSLTSYLSDPKYGKMSNRSYRGQSRGDGSELVPDEAPDPQRLGAPVYPGSQYTYAASGPSLALYTTDDSPDKAIAFYSKGKKVMSAQEVRDALKKAVQVDPAEMMAMMQRGADLQKFTQQMQEVATSGADWTKGIDGEQGVENPRFIALEEKAIGEKKIPSKMVVVWQDQSLGKTAVAFPLPPQRQGGIQPAEGEDPALMMRIIQRLSGQ
jgi:hypothetical protein